MSKQKQENDQPNQEKKKKKGLFGIESLEPRVLLSATLGNLFGAEDAEVEAAADALGDDVDLGTLDPNADDLFGGSDGESGDGGEGLEAWLGDREAGDTLSAMVGQNEAPETMVDHFHVGAGETATTHWATM